MPLLTPATRSEYMTLLDAAALSASDAPAIIYLQTEHDPITVTRTDFAKITAGYAAALQEKGIHPGDLVAIAHTQNLESIYLFWAALRIGALPSMFPTLTDKLDPDIYMDSMATLVKNSGVAAIFTTDDFAPQLGERVSCPVYGSITPPSSFTERGWQPQADGGEAESVAFLQHSSGTTGLQKGVALSHRAVLNQLSSYSDALDLREDDVIVSWLPLYHDMGLIAGFLLPLVQGVPLVLMSPFDWVAHPAMLLRAIDQYQGTLCWLPNFAYNHCARRIRKRDTEGLSLASMRAFINCSEPVYHSSHQLFLDRFADNGVREDQLAVSYAMAENTFAVTQTPMGQAPALDIVDRAALENEHSASPIDPNAPTAQINVSCGPPIDGVQVRVVDGDGKVLPERSVGEILVKSEFMLAGYHHRPDLNETLFEDGWYLTGDMGYVADGEVYIAGRKKDLIINGGKNVYPQDIEAIVNTIEGVHPGRAVAFGVWDDRDGTELIGIIAEVESDNPDDRRSIGSAIRQRIVQQTTVSASYVHLVEKQWLIKTSSGKLARAANRDKWLAEKKK